MAGRPKHFENEELIDKAMPIFWAKGYTATSAQDLLKAMEIGQGSFYRAFPGGKKELYQLSLLQFITNTTTKFNTALEETTHPIKFIESFFENIAIRSAQNMKNGCYLGNAIVEMSNVDEDTKVLSAKHLLKLQTGFENALVKAQDLKLLDNNKDPKILATYLLNLWNGLNVTLRMITDEKDIKALIKLNLEILE